MKDGGVILIFVLPLITVLGAYLLGCFNGAVIVSKYILKDDIRKHGSGNAGLTNFYRSFGGPLTFLVISTDVFKAVLAVLLGQWLFGHFLGLAILGKYIAGLSCMLGHMFPCMFGFKGGKGILSGGTIAIMIDWRIAVVVWGGFILLAALTRWVSLGSVYAGVTFPIATWFVFHNWSYFLLSLVCGGLIVWRHRSNLKRILNGTESKFSFHHKTEDRP